MTEGRFRLGISKKFFTVRVIRHRSRLTKEAADAPSHVKLDGVQDNMVY